MKTLLIGSRNEGKQEEIRNHFEDVFQEIETPQELDVDLDPEETGDSFRENARMKARSYHEETGLVSLSDDSGLCVPALGGDPGIHSARYAGEDATDAQNNHKLMTEMENVPMEGRTARFVCVMVLTWSDGMDLVSTGECQGYITAEPRGSGGFGYDPLFLPEGRDQTFAQMSKEQKNQISHRARAIRNMKEFFDEIKG